jgi:hypothetical protein
MTINQSKTQSYLGDAAVAQKAGAKPCGLPARERSQDDPAMGRHEEARSCYPTGCRFGLSRGRVCAPVTKPVSPTPSVVKGMLGSTEAVRRDRMAWVMREITSGQWLPLFTGELPPRLGSWSRVTHEHKARPKPRAHARAAGTGAPRLRPWGTQQSQSTAPPCTASTERLNHRKPGLGIEFMGLVSPMAYATKWPVPTSSGQPIVRLRNNLQQFVFRDRAVRSRKEQSA